MRTEEQFLCGIHRRAAALRREKERRQTAAWSALSIALTVLLALETVTPHAPGTGMMTGASLLSDMVGGYVLTAVVAFMLGVAITVLLRHERAKKKAKEENNLTTGEK